jgi:hypothetical protein
MDSAKVTICTIGGFGGQRQAATRSDHHPGGSAQGWLARRTGEDELKIGDNSLRTLAIHLGVEGRIVGHPVLEDLHYEVGIAVLIFT